MAQTAAICPRPAVRHVPWHARDMPSAQFYVIRVVFTSSDYTTRQKCLGSAAAPNSDAAARASYASDARPCARAARRCFSAVATATVALSWSGSTLRLSTLTVVASGACVDVDERAFSHPVMVAAGYGKSCAILPCYAFKIDCWVVKRRPVPRARRSGVIPRASARASAHNVVRTICAPQHQSSTGRIRAARGRPSVPRGVHGWVDRTTTRCGSWVDLGGLVRGGRLALSAEPSRGTITRRAEAGQKKA